MAKTKTRTTVFLIVDKNESRGKIAGDLRIAGYDVHEYMTANEFLFDKVNHTRGVVVAGFRLRGLNGLELCEKLKDEVDDFPVVLMASHQDFPTAIASQAAELALQPVGTQSLIAAITRVIEGDDVTEFEVDRGFRHISNREHQVLDLVVSGNSNAEVAEILQVSAKTVEALRARIMAKSRARDVWELVRMWRVWKRIDEQQ